MYPLEMIIFMPINICNDMVVEIEMEEGNLDSEVMEEVTKEVMRKMMREVMKKVTRKMVREV